ncbi:MAG TPA: protein kinase [Actinomycetota bacterium]|nr:protein kinase [Actinomycetota bacterium]
MAETEPPKAENSRSAGRHGAPPPSPPAGPASPAGVQDARSGTRIAGFTVISRIGRGGMGVVYLAEQARLGRRVALKLLSPEAGSDEDLRRRFVQRESRLAATLEHPNVVPVYDAGEEPDGTLWLAMRFVDGDDLGRMLQREGPLDLDRTLDLLGQVASALDAAHRKGLIHRDVKPQNILVEGRPPTEHAYLTDFGLTRGPSSSRMTASQSFLGTVAYAAPETIVGREDVDGRADVYSLGCVLFECLTGSVPFAQPTDIAILWSHLNSEPPRVTAFRPELPPELDDVLRTALAKEPEHRYPGAGALVEAARMAVAGHPVLKPSPPVEAVVRAPDDAGGTGTTLIDPDGVVPVSPDPTAKGVGAGRVSVQLIPIESRGRRSAKHRIRIENTGSLAARVHLEGDSRMPATADIAPDSVVVPPDGVSWSGVWVRPARLRAIGRRRLPFRVSALPDGADRVVLRGVMVRPPPVFTWALAVAIVGSMGVGAFLASGSGHHPLPTAPPTAGGPTASPTSTILTTCPLTGTAASSEAVSRRSELVVKVDNADRSEVRGEQRGLGQADVVFEEPIEAGATRLAAVFQCSPLPRLVGPVRGPRPTDPGLLAQLGRPLFAFGDDQLVPVINLHGVVIAREGAPRGGFIRTGAPEPFNLFAKPASLFAALSAGPPRALFHYAKAAPSGAPAQTTVRVPPFGDLVWRYEGATGRYARFYGTQPHLSDGTQLTAANVIVERVRAHLKEMAGGRYEFANTLGEGPATVFRDGVMIRGTWSRPTPDDRTVFTDSEGTEIALAPGPTWIELVPTNG